MYGLTNFLAVLWHTVAGWFGVGRNGARAVTLFNGDDDPQRRESSDFDSRFAKITSIDALEPGDTEEALRHPGPYTSLGEAVANGGSGVKIGSGTYL